MGTAHLLCSHKVQLLQSKSPQTSNVKLASEFGNSSNCGDVQGCFRISITRIWNKNLFLTDISRGCHNTHWVQSFCHQLQDSFVERVTSSPVHALLAERANCAFRSSFSSLCTKTKNTELCLWSGCGMVVITF